MANAVSGHLYLGTSGFQYRHWRGNFYPDGVPQRRWLEHYASCFNSVELNATFYRLPKQETFRGWRERVPEGFRYALKFSRYGSHTRRLRDAESTVQHFLEAIEPLGDRIGPVLVQLPPSFEADPARLAAFLEAAPGSCRWVLEFRHPSWLQDDILDLLAEHGAGLCVHDGLDDHPWVATADWVYWRFHGETHDQPCPAGWMDRAAAWLGEQRAAGRDVYAYFNNDGDGHAPRDAEELRRRLEAGAG